MSKSTGYSPSRLHERRAASSSLRFRSASSKNPLLPNGMPQQRRDMSGGYRISYPAFSSSERMASKRARWSGSPGEGPMVRTMQLGK